MRCVTRPQKKKDDKDINMCDSILDATDAEAVRKVRAADIVEAAGDKQVAPVGFGPVET